MNKQRLAGGALVVAVIGLALLTVAKDHPTAGASKRQVAIPVKTELATRGAAAILADAVGTVQAFNAVSIRSRIDGQIANLRFTEGGRVRRGQVLVELDKRPWEVQLHAAQAQLAKDTAQMPAAKRNLERYQDLLSHGAVTQQMLENVRATFDQLRAAVDADQAQIDQARLQLDYASIRAPIDGRVGARLVDVGNIVHAGDANGIVNISQLQPITISFSLPQARLPVLLRQQAAAPLLVLAQLDDGAAAEEGRLTLVDSQIDAATGTIRCKATFDNKTERLWPGAFVDVSVRLKSLPDAVTVPTAALQTGQRGAYVYVVGRDNRVRQREVQTGPAALGRTVILSGVKTEEQVVVEGQFQVEAGALVAPQPGPVSAH